LTATDGAAIGSFVTRVRDLMSPVVKTLGRNDKLSIADEVMAAERIRHLPVLDENGDLCGIVSQRDLFRGALARALGYGDVARSKILGALVVKEVMTTDVVVTAPDTPAAAAARTMLERKIGCLPVVDGGRLVGIVTESDFLRVVAGGVDRRG
jgi:CBS domain-containing membrane protein